MRVDSIPPFWGFYLLCCLRGRFLKRGEVLLGKPSGAAAVVDGRGAWYIGDEIDVVVGGVVQSWGGKRCGM